MAASLQRDLGRRERQIMDIVYRLGSATVGDVLGQLADPPSYSAVRAMLGYLETKGLLRHRQEAQRYVYSPVIPREQARRSALHHVVSTFFGGSRARAVAALLELPPQDLTDDDFKALTTLIKRARSEGR